MFIKNSLASTFLAASAIMICGLSSANAGPIFTENFNSYAGIQNAFQNNTGLPVAYSGTVAGWSSGGVHAIHGVQVADSDWAVMLYWDNLISLDVGIAANTEGSNYVVDFDYGTGDYASEVSQGTPDSVGLTIQLRRPDNSVLAERTYLSGAWGQGNYLFQAGLHGTLAYTGDGSGDVRLFIFNSNQAEGQFGGSIDNIAVSGANVAPAATPEPAGFMLAGPGLAAMGWFIARRRRGAAR